MRMGSWYGDIARSLRDGLFADRVILALAKVQRNQGPIPEEDRQLFGRASNFLGDAISGYRWLDQPSLNSSSMSHANLFGQAVRALSITSIPVDFLAHLNGLKGISDQLSLGERPELAEVGKLREFFVNHSTAEMRRSDGLFESAKKRGTSAWGILGA